MLGAERELHVVVHGSAIRRMCGRTCNHFDADYRTSTVGIRVVRDIDT